MNFDMGRILAVLLLASALPACHAAAVDSRPADPAAPAKSGYEVPSDAELQMEQTPAVDLRSLPQLGGILPTLADKQAVFVGEQHDQYAHHLVQLTIVRELHKRHPDLVIGMEFFQKPYQEHLDDFVEKRIDEPTMLSRTEYFRRWQYDYRLYRPILQYARQAGVRILALNVPAELTERVADVGLDGLSEAEKAAVPADMDQSNEIYRERLRRIFQHHPEPEKRNFDHFVQAQLLWDEGMAETAAAYFRDNPEGHMVILAGSGHIANRDGIPDRLSRRVNVSSSVVVNGIQETLSPAVADFVLLPKERRLPPAGRMGILLEDASEGVVVGGFTETSPARKAGVEEGARIVNIGGRTVDTVEDVRVALYDKAPGDVVSMEVANDRFILGDSRRTFQITLQ